MNARVNGAHNHFKNDFLLEFYRIWCSAYLLDHYGEALMTTCVEENFCAILVKEKFRAICVKEKFRAICVKEKFRASLFTVIDFLRGR